MIQALLPLASAAVDEALKHEGTTLAGARRCVRDDGAAGIARWGTNRVAVYLANHKVPVTVPRVRDLRTNTDRPLVRYAALHATRARDVGLFRRGLSGMSTRDDHAAPGRLGVARVVAG